MIIIGTWLTLVISLPTPNATVRMRIWRALKGLGCAVLRDGVYLLPGNKSAAQALQQQATEILAAGGSAYLLNVEPTDPQQADFFHSLFDRTADYAALHEEVAACRAGLDGADPASTRRALTRLRKDFAAIAAMDFFPGAAREQVEAALEEVESEFIRLTSPDEPRAMPGAIQPLDRTEYKKRIWATRKKLWVDRMASAWLIHRFIDSKARFLWLEKPRDCPPHALGFDFDGAAFTHVGARVTFEVLAASFNLEHDPALSRIGALVHYLDVGGLPVAEAAGLEMILKGAKQRCADDDALLAETAKIFDDLYAAYEEKPV